MKNFLRRHAELIAFALLILTALGYFFLGGTYAIFPGLAK